MVLKVRNVRLGHRPRHGCLFGVVDTTLMNEDRKYKGNLTKNNKIMYSYTLRALVAVTAIINIIKIN